MSLHFYKYQGAGNDFIIVDGRVNMPELSTEDIHFLCDRRFGIGADGLMIIGNAPEVDFTMRYYNADGKEGTMCGNGGRCLVAFAARNSEMNHFLFSAIDGIHRADVIERNGQESQIRLEMNNVNNITSYGKEGFFLNTGSPHLVLFGTDITNLDVTNQGAFWRNHPDFAPKGTNVNFVEIERDGTLFVRTFERGVEAETLACGTGVTAAAIATYLYAKKDHTFSIRTLGGNLQVSFKERENSFYDVQLTGPATFVFEGNIQNL